MIQGSKYFTRNRTQGSILGKHALRRPQSHMELNNRGGS